MDWSDADLERIPEADRRIVDPPIPVETATWSNAGQLDWWVKERLHWWIAYAMETAVKGWSRAVDLRPARGSQS